MKTVRNICTAALIGLGMNVIAQTATMMSAVAKEIKN